IPEPIGRRGRHSIDMNEIRKPLCLGLCVALGVVACGSGEDKAPLPWVPSRVDWRFERPTDRLDAEVAIANDPGERVGMYVVVFRGKIASTPFYFGVQTNVWQPDVGWI